MSTREGDLHRLSSDSDSEKEKNQELSDNRQKFRKIIDSREAMTHPDAILRQNLGIVAAKAIAESFSLSSQERTQPEQTNKLDLQEKSKQQTTDIPTSLQTQHQEKDDRTRAWLRGVTPIYLYQKLTKEELLREAHPNETTLPGGKWPKESLRYLAVAYSRDEAFPSEVKAYIEANKQMRFDDKHAQYIFNQASHYYRLEKGEKVNDAWREAATKYIKSYELQKENFDNGGHWTKEELTNISSYITQNHNLSPELAFDLSDNPDTKFTEKEAQYLIKQATSFYERQKGHKPDQNWTQQVTQSIKDYTKQDTQSSSQEQRSAPKGTNKTIFKDNWNNSRRKDLTKLSQRFGVIKITWCKYENYLR